MNETAYGVVDTVTEEVASDSKTIHISSSKDVEKAVREYFADIPVMIQVARCESTFRHTTENGNVLRGTVDNRDVGVMQINTGYHALEAKKLGLDLLAFKDNMAYARHLYEAKGTQPWSSSSKCWNPSLARI